MQKCQWCLEWKNYREFRVMKRRVEMMDSDVSMVEEREHQQTLCKVCEARKKRYKRGTQTEADILNEIAASLRRLS